MKKSLKFLAGVLAAVTLLSSAAAVAVSAKSPVYTDQTVPLAQNGNVITFPGINTEFFYKFDDCLKEGFVNCHKHHCWWWNNIYCYYKDHGVELIVHHSDSYAANIVPYMIKMGIDIWQGCFPQNNLPELINEKGFAGKITFMGEIETRLLDLPDWTQEAVVAEVERACRKCKGPSFIPCLTSGLPGSSFPGVYEAVSAEIDRMSKELF